MQFYCADCDVILCVECLIEGHIGHKRVKATAIFKSCRAAKQELLGPVSGQVSELVEIKKGLVKMKEMELARIKDNETIVKAFCQGLLESSSQKNLEDKAKL